jgi:hypothetical protein
MVQSLWHWVRRRTTRVSGGDDESVSTDYARDREDNRLAHMSEEDRAWETASLERERAARERTETTPR